MTRVIHGENVKGVEVDPQTRCEHWKSDLDIIAIKFKCCGDWYSCFECHAAVAGHEAEVWPLDERHTRAILCGACGHQLTIGEYLDRGSVCPSCESGFNPGCAKHYDLYFALA